MTIPQSVMSYALIVAPTRIGAAVLLGIALTACAQAPAATPPPQTPPFAVSLPPSTEEPTTAPTTAPTAQATTVPTTPRPRPSTRRAGEQMLPYYFAARQLFPILPPTPQIDLDEPLGTDGDAFYRGLNVVGLPIFAVREDFVMTPRAAYHEIGHAFDDIMWRQLSAVADKHQSYARDRYWAFRGFPGTWQEAERGAELRTGMAQWMSLPNESWAEAFSIAAVGSGGEKTFDYGKTIDPVATRAFFRSLMQEAMPNP